MAHTTATNCVLAFGPENQYFYAGGKLRTKRTKIIHRDAKDIKWLAFGERANSYLVSYATRLGEFRVSWGPDVPAPFLRWLVDPDTDKLRRSSDVRVAFGPDDSFVAWDNTAMRWHNIHPKLEEQLQEWLSRPDKYGKLRLVCLGQNQSFLAISALGGWSCSGLPPKMHEELVAARHDVGSTLAAALSMFGPQWMFVQNKRYCYDITSDGVVDERIEDALCSVLDPVAYDAIDSAKRKITRLEERMKQRDARIKVLEHEKQLEENRVLWRLWKRDCDKYFTMKRRTAFIDTPEIHQKCVDYSCLLRKKDSNSIGVCKHDIKSILRGSGQYHIKYLRSERLRWHPDQFARSCDASVRQELTAKATQMYAIMEELIAEENKHTDKENVRP